VTTITHADLVSWNDPEDLLRALGAVTREQFHELGDAVARLADHHDPDVREEALRIAAVLWKDAAVRPNVVTALRTDSEAAVRSTAAYGLAALSRPETRSQDLRLLLEIVVDEDQDVSVRMSAYDGLLILHRRPSFPSLDRDANPRTDIDWSWIAELQKQTSSTRPVL
jgi:HEAT repeat protein